MPVTIKDAIAGLRTTGGSALLADHVPDDDAVVVARLRAAGAIVLGKTNVPVLSAAVQTRNPLFGRTNNLWDATRAPGGSSGGSAAAVASGMTPLDMKHGVDVWVAMATAERNWTMKSPDESAPDVPDVRQYAQTLMHRDALIRSLEDFFDTWDALLCPATGIAAFPHMDKPTPFMVGGKKVAYYKPLTPFTMLFNITGQPVVVLPLGLTAAGLPVGVQVVGRRWGEARLLGIARTLFAFLGPTPRPPGF